ncbi:MAG: hypothetical protein RMK74_10605 [Myxococcales bacterium]|nr:hypothetical protein [Myxococcales bacterium]
MSDPHRTAAAAPDHDPYRIAGGPWESAWKHAAVLGAVGLALAAFGATTEPRRAAFSWLFAFTFVLTLGLGSLFFVMVQHLTSAGWSVTVRRTAETFAAAMPVLLVLFVPVWLGRGHLYAEWLHHAEHGKPETPQQALHAALLEHKHGYLDEGFWTLRALVYFAIWIALAAYFFRTSTGQDRSRDPAATVRMQRLAPGGLILFGASLTFAAFDWLMSLNPTWYSTIFGVYVFAGAAIAVHALLIVVTLALRARGHLGDAVHVEHYHDLGKLMFGFVVFWAYIGFSQMMLIWYAAIPEEQTFYHHRWNDGGWRTYSWMLLFGHFVLPFLFLLSRNIKRRLPLLGFGAGWLLVMHAADVYWFVMPTYEVGRLAFHWLDVACLLGAVGTYLAAVLWLMRRHALVPLGDPRLARSLAFQNA